MFIVITIVLFSIYCAYKAQIGYINRNKPKRERIVIIYPKIFANQDENFKYLVNQDKNIITNSAASKSNFLNKKNVDENTHIPCPCCTFPW